MANGIIKKKKEKDLTLYAIIWLIGTMCLFYFVMLLSASYEAGHEDILAGLSIRLSDWRGFFVGISPIGIKYWGILELICTALFLFYATKQQYDFKDEEYGDAHWAKAKEFTKKFGNHDDSNLVKVNTGDIKVNEDIYVNTKNYWLAEDVFVNIDNKETSNLNMLTIGPPGTGKSFRVVRPILSQLCGNFVVTDPKGELYHQTGQFFEDNGYEVMVLNVESEDAMPMSIHFNPFKYIRNESDIMSIASILMKATTPPDATSDAFFEQSAEVLLTDILYILHYYYPEEKQNWREFVKLLESTTVHTDANGKILNYGMPEYDEKGNVIGVKGGDDCDKGILAIMTEADRKWKEDGHDGHFYGYVDIEKYYNGAAETTSSIVASLDTHCKYMKLECVQNLLCEDDIQIRKSFGYSEPCKASPTGKRILYIVTNENQRYFDWIPSMIYSIFFDELYHLCAIDPDLHETLNQHLTFLMDEFANITLPDSFVERLSTMRSRNMSAHCIVQNLLQLKQKFPKNDLDHNMIGQMTVIQVLGAPDNDSCEYLSKMFGTMTIHKQSSSDTLGKNGSSSKSDDVLQKPLFSAEAMFQMTKDGPCAIVVKGSDPLYEPKVQFQNSPLKPLLCRYPYYEPKPRKTNFEVLNSILDKEEMCLSGKEIDAFYDELERACDDTNKDFREFKEQNIIHLTMDELLFITEQHEEQLSKELPQEEKWTKSQLISAMENANTLNTERESMIIDFKKYNKEKMVMVQRLINSGFNPAQINALTDMINQEDCTVESILQLFNPNMSVNQIEDFVKLGVE